MYNFSGPGRTRQINLSGTRASQSSEALLRQARAKREAREEEQRRHDSQVKIARWYRSLSAARQVREHYGQQFDAGPAAFAGPVDWTRCLLVSGTKGQSGEARLGAWSAALVSEPQALYGPFSTRDATRWLDMLCRMSVRLLQTVSASPHSPHTLNHLTVLQNLLIPQRMPKSLTPATTQDIARSVVTTLIPAKSCIYPYLNHAIISVDPKDKSSPILPPLIELALAPISLLTSIGSNTGIVYQEVLERFFSCILAIPLLPYRLPLPVVTRISTRFPFSHIGRLDLYSVVRKLESGDSTGGSADETKAELIANLFTFLPPPLLARLKAAERADYLNLLAALFDSLPPNSLDPPKSSSNPGNAASMDIDSDSDDDNLPAAVSANAAAAPAPVHLVLNPRTRKRLEQLTESAYLNVLLGSSAIVQADTAICRFFLSLWSVWPARRDTTLAAILALPGGASTNGAYAIVKGVWRSQVRGALGKLGDGAGATSKSIEVLIGK
ncbi:hypothetical protein RhiJN_14464 [Ceratobasidium sp. AG-Ba]|nr:hypothetical protein RhiJN_14464 [Ceratobasidium sp. AG-Ba]QRW15006.1 hypothetical protein RhiLY_14005 [Ceratobasidium sp. AG-Ba]